MVWHIFWVKLSYDSTPWACLMIWCNSEWILAFNWGKYDFCAWLPLWNATAGSRTSHCTSMHGKGDGFQRMPKVSNGMVYVGCGSMLRSSKIDGPHNPPNPHEIFNSCCRSDFAGFCMLLFWTSWTSNVSVFWGRTSLDIFGMSTCIFWLDVHWPPGFELPKKASAFAF